jgi:hypothetical protein
LAQTARRRGEDHEAHHQVRAHLDQPHDPG